MKTIIKGKTPLSKVKTTIKDNISFLKDTMKITKNKKGAMGIGTLIIFIAIVLVAAVAATVLITTSSTMQKRAYETSKKTLHQVSTNMDIISVTGVSTNQTNLTGATHVTDTLHEVSLTIRLSPGADNVDLRRTVLAYGTSNVSIRPIIYNVSARDNPFLARDNNVSDFAMQYLETTETSRDDILETGETIELSFWIEDIYGDLPPTTHEDIKITIIPDIGIPTSVEVTTPEVIERMYTKLYP